MSTLGLDVGTTGCKAVVFDAQGQPLASAYREYPVLSPREGWAELDSGQVCDSCLSVIREAAGQADDPVQALGISSQGEAFTPVGPGGKLLGNAMVSSDNRAAEIARTWSAAFGPEKLYEITGHTPHPMFTVFKLLWLRDEKPQVWRSAESFLCFEDLLNIRLGLPATMGYPLAGRTMLFNVRTHQWDEHILSAVGLDRSKLARPLPSGTVVGRIAPDVARDLGLAEGAVTVTGGHDQPCGAIGAGVVEEGMAMYASGTVECICPVFPQEVFSPELFAANLCTYDYTIGGMYTTVAFSLTGGNLLKWFRDQWARQETAEAARTGQDAYELILRTMADRPTGLLVLPYFTPSGTPYFDTETRGAILGLRLTSTRGQVLRALMEGVAYEMRLNLEILAGAGIAIRELRAIGGGARSAALTQLKADVLDRPITTVAVTEAGCMGAAMLAHAALTEEDVRSVAGRWVHATAVVEPDPGAAEVYRERFQSYRKLRPALQHLS
jgi:xylulokinase